ncbi:hypothetical protein BN1708_011202 [Verticillium longisporum]|uniref:DUF676 domain-containing protein n=1 Tax=Verticillium longisporum TaxID=100787 RepID=A0A0G4KY24_VERLO|nr:hypothetical protein BN1708_011202 [Verticillium longisporum]
MPSSSLSRWVDRTLSRTQAMDHPQGLDGVYEGDNPIVDIVALHGLNGHREKTWTAENGVHWLRDLLPKDLPQARILCYGYDANTHSTRRVSWNNIYDHATNLVSDLYRKRKITNSINRPIIFIAHSLGGIVLKSALIHSNGAQTGALPEHRSIKLSTYGILFMGTPHQGGNGVQLGRVLANVASLFVAANDRLLKQLEHDSESLQQQLVQFNQISNDFVIKFVYEEYKTPTILGHSIMVCLCFTLPLSLSGLPERSHFVAREEELARMYQALGNKPGRRTVVVHGLGGMGKTQLAIAYMRQHRNLYTASIWLNARDQTSLHQGFRNVAVRILQEYPDLGYMANAASDKNGNASLAVKRWLNESKNDRWLLIYDNYDHPVMEGVTDDVPLGEVGGSSRPNETDQAAPEGYDIRQFLPDTDHGAIIVTTRSSAVQIGELLQLQKLHDIGDSLRILEATSNRKGVQDDASAVALARKLDGLPLALSTAGAYIRELATPWEQYLQDYETEWSKLQRLSPQLLAYGNRALYSTWNISYDSIRQRSESAAMLLRLWAFFGNEDLWFELLRQGREDGPKWLQDLTESRLVFDESMRVLCSHGLVEAHSTTVQPGPESNGYSVHGCVHSWMVHVLNAPNEQGLRTLAMVCLRLHVPDLETPESWLIQRRLMLHADRCRQLLDQADDQWSRTKVAESLATLYMYQEKHEESELMCTQALQGYEKLNGPKDISRLNVLNILGILYQDTGRLKEAESIYEQVLQGYEKAWGLEHTLTLNTVNTLGIRYQDTGRLKEAESIYEQVLQGYEKAWGLEHTSTLNMVNNLGLLYQDQGQLKEAESMFERALQDKEKARRLDHTSTLDTVHNLGTLYLQQGRLEEAESILERALQGYEKAYGPEHDSTLGTVNNLGLVYKLQGQLKEAESMLEWALRGSEKAWGPEHIKTLESVNNLSTVYHEIGQLKEAEAMYIRALQGYEKALGKEAIATWTEQLKRRSCI